MPKIRLDLSSVGSIFWPLLLLLLVLLLHLGSGCVDTSQSEDEVAEALNPIEEHFGVDLTFERFTISDQIRADEAIRDCMAEQGFEYNVPTRRELERAFPQDIDLPRDEYANTLGYGIAASVNADVGAILQLEARSKLSPEEQAKYDFALQGDLENSSNGGCSAETARIYGIAPEGLPHLFQELDALEAAVRSDARYLGLSDRWSECMAGHGYRLRDTDHAQSVFRAYAAQIDPRIPSEVELTGDELPEQPKDLDSLREIEIRVAMQDFECLEPMRLELLDIQREYQLEFLDANKGLFEAKAD